MTVTRPRLRRLLRLTVSSGALAAGLAMIPGLAQAQCAPSGGTTFSCSGTNTTTQTVFLPSAIVTTTPGFSIDTRATGGNALTIQGDGSLAYNDGNGSSLTAADAGLQMIATGDFGADLGRIFIDTAGDISGVAGIFTQNFGSGATNITARGTIRATTASGISALNDVAGADLTINAASVSSASGGRAIDARNFGTGATSVTATGTVIAMDGTGIFAQGDVSTTQMTVNATDVIGGSRGIAAFHNGAGLIDINVTGAVSARSGIGLVAVGDTNNVGVRIDVNNVAGAIDGVLVENDGIGATQIVAAGDIVGTGGTGLSLTHGANARLAEVIVNNVSGAGDGIHILNNGLDLTLVNAAGTVAGTSGTGILVESNGTGPSASISISAVDVFGGVDGIRIVNNGAGSVFGARSRITAIGDVVGSTGDGIGVLNGATATDLTIDAVNVTGNSDGVEATNLGAGVTRITVAGDVIATGSGTGIDAENGVTTTGLSIEVNNVTGGGFGIFAQHAGSGATSITSTGMIDGGSGAGIDASNDVNGTTLTIEVNDVIGGAEGIVAFNQGTGTTRVLASGDVTGAGGGGIGVTGGPDTAGIIIDVDGDVAGGAFGISTEHNGMFVTSIRVGGDVSGTGEQGVRAINRGPSTTSLTINVGGDVSGGTFGIDAVNEGANTSIRVGGDVSGETGAGIRAVNEAGATSLSIIIDGNVRGATSGVIAGNSGSSATDIITAGDVTGGSGVGIGAFNADTAAGLTISANNVTGVGAGIQAVNSGTGVTVVTSTGTVAGTGGAGATGIFVVNDASATDMTVTANHVHGGDGVFAWNLGTGETNVTATGDVVGTGGNFGVLVNNGASATDLTLSVANATHDRLLAVSVVNEGVGATHVTATGNVTGRSGGILARNGTTSTSLTVQAANVTGDEGTGIVGRNDGGGATRITTTGDVRGGVTGIDVRTGATTTDLAINVASVRGDGLFGVFALNGGAGATSVAATGHVSGINTGLVVFSEANTTGSTIETARVTGFDGIFAINSGLGAQQITTTGLTIGTEGTGLFARNGATATDLTISTADVIGDMTGIEAWNDGVGVTHIAATGNLTGTNAYGMFATNGANATDLTIATAGVTGGFGGIEARNMGSGATSVTAAGAVSGGAASGDGISVTNEVSATDLRVSSAAVTGGRFGIVAFNTGMGETNVTATGPVRGGQIGVNALNDTAAGDLSVSVASAGGGVYGVNAGNEGGGATRVTVTDTVTGAGNTGLRVYNGATASDLMVTAANASGGMLGISARNDGTGTTRIETTGLIEGGTSAILARSAGQSITLVNTGAIRNASGHSSSNAIQIVGGPATLSNTGTIVGALALGDGADLFTNSGLWNSAGGVSDFRAGLDTLDNGASGTLIAASDRSTAEISRYDGLEALNNAGLVTLSDGGSGDRLQTSGAVRFAASSVYRVDIGGAGGADLVAAGGAVTLDAGRLEANLVGMPVLGARYTILTGSSVTGRFDFADQMLTAFAGVADGYTPTSAYLEFAQMRALADAGETPNQIATAGGADSLAVANPVRTALVLLPDDATARAAFDQLSGEIHPSARTAAVEDSRLPRNAALDRLADGESDGAVWARAYGDAGLSDGDFNAARVERDARGVVFGVDGALGPVTLGVAAGWSDTDLQIARRNSEGSVESVHGLVYAGARFGAWGVRGGVGYAQTSTGTERRIAFPGFSATLTADYGGSVVQGFVEAGYRMPLGGGHVEPFANLTVLRAETDAFTETSGAAALTVDEASETSTISTLGLRFETNPMGALSLRGSAGWRHSFGDLDPVNVHAFDGGAPFTILGAAQSTDAAAANVEAVWRLSPNVTVGVAYDGVLGTDGEDHGVLTVMRVVF